MHCAVTGAFGFSGRYIARRLIEQGAEVRTLTNSPKRQDLFEKHITVYPLCFSDQEALVSSLRGVEVLYNTYWVRFNTRRFSFANALRNTRTLFDAAREAGVRRVVHTSITNPSEQSPLEYLRRKAMAEKCLVESGLSYAILRPAILFGEGDILVNNIAWALRRLPVFGVFGNGRYKVRPIHVDDFARLAIELGERGDNVVADAVGPETFTYRELVRLIASVLKLRRVIMSVPPVLGYLAAWCTGKVLGDVMLTWDEVRALMAGLLTTDSPATGTTRLSDWARKHAETLGRKYASELARRRIVALHQQGGK